MRKTLMIGDGQEKVIFSEPYYQAVMGMWIEGEPFETYYADYFMLRSEEQVGASQVSRKTLENGVVTWLQ